MGGDGFSRAWRAFTGRKRARMCWWKPRPLLKVTGRTEKSMVKCAGDSSADAGREGERVGCGCGCG